MLSALAEARLGIGLTAPNPPVGALISRDGAVLGQGHHQKAGGPHAEIEALRAAAALGHDVSGATIFITLEPCSTAGRTPPCVQALIQAKLARVVWGARDPNPAHQGRAEALLLAAGISVITGVCETECQEILRPFTKHITTALPWVIAKAGMSLDGRITRPAGEGQWLTSPAARADAMLLRSTCEAVLVGAETIRRDNPSLTVRDPALRPGQPQPWRVILTKSGQLPPTARIFTDEDKDRTLVRRGQALETVFRDLASRGVLSVLIEGGGQVLASAFSGGWVDEVVFYIAPLISGSGRPVVEATAFSGASIPMQLIDSKQIEDDLRVRAFVKKELSP
jgi:diaminohydroxyphosphoribosylaminopyrimidine deaminase / 5-amino-6-(5-phosphoribosylamino)uracil reductase